MIFQLAVLVVCVVNQLGAPKIYTKPNKTTLNFFSNNLAHAVQKPRNVTDDVSWLYYVLDTQRQPSAKHSHTRLRLDVHIYIYGSNAHKMVHILCTATTQKILMSLREILFIFENDTKVLGVYFFFSLNSYRLCLFALQRNDCALSFSRGKIVAYIRNVHFAPMT